MQELNIPEKATNDNLRYIQNMVKTVKKKNPYGAGTKSAEDAESKAKELEAEIPPPKRWAV